MTILIFLLALLPRILFLNLIEFKADEALTVFDLQSFFQSPHLITQGLVSSVGMRNFPLFHYLLLIPGFISLDPRFLSGFIGFMNAIVIAFFYHVTKRYYGKHIAVIASLLFATNPWSILFSRKIWAQDLIPLFAVPIYYFLHRVFQDKHQKAVVPLFVLLTLVSQIHASGIFFSVIIAGYCVIKKVNIRLIIFGVLVGFIPAIPYFLNFSTFSISASSHVMDLKNLYLPFTMVGMIGWREIMGADLTTLFSWYPFLREILYGMSLASILCLLYGLKKIQTKWILVCIVSMPILYILFQVPARLHYYQIIVPFLMLALGAGIASFKKLYIIAVVANLFFVSIFFNYLYKTGGVGGDYGTTYHESKQLVDLATNNYMLRDDYERIRLQSFFYTSTPKYERLARIHYGLANYFYDHHDYATAKQELETVLILDPDNQRVRDTLRRL